MPKGSKLGYPKEEKKKKELILGKIVDEIRKVIKGRIREKVLIQKGDYRQYKPLSNSNWDHPSKNKTELGEISSKVKNKIKDIMKYDHIDDLADYIEQFDIDKSKWKVISHYFDDIRDETMGIKPSGYADRSRKELEKILFKVI